MLKTTFALTWGWVVAAILTLNICLDSANAQGKLPNNTRHLPKDATAIISVRIGDLLKKGGYDEFLQSDLVKMAKAEMVDNELALKILDDPEASGIDLGEPIHIFIKLGAPAEEFGEPTVTGGLITSLKDAKALDKAIDLITAKAGLPLIKTAQEGYTQLSMPGAPATIGWTSKAMVAVGSSDPKQMQKIANLLDKTINRKAKIKDERLVSLLSTKADMSAWIEYDQIVGLMSSIPGAEEAFGFGLTEKLSKNAAYALTMNFEAGRMDMAAVEYNETELIEGDLSRGGLGKALVDLIPNNSIMAMGFAMNMKPMREMMNKHVLPELLAQEGVEEMVAQAEAMIGLTLEGLMEIPKGDFLAVWDGLKMEEGDFGPQPSPQLMLGMTVENRKNLNKIMNNPQVQGLLPMLATVGMQIAQTEEGIFLCSRNHANAINNGKNENPIKGDHRDLISKNDFGGFFRFAPLVKVIRGMVPPDAAEVQTALGELNRLDEITMSGSMLKDGKQSSSVSLTFKDKKTNALRQLIQTGERIYKLAQMAEAERPDFELEADEELRAALEELK